MPISEPKLGVFEARNPLRAEERFVQKASVASTLQSKFDHTHPHDELTRKGNKNEERQA